MKKVNAFRVRSDVTTKDPVIPADFLIYYNYYYYWTADSRKQPTNMAFFSADAISFLLSSARENMKGHQFTGII